MSSVNKSKIKKNTKKKNRLLVLVCCLVAMGFTVAAALNIPWLCLGSMVCVGVAIVLDD